MSRLCRLSHDDLLSYFDLFMVGELQQILLAGFNTRVLILSAGHCFYIAVNDVSKTNS